MLPDYVNMIFLSATTPNTVEFSDWIGRTKRKNVHVVTTDYRPVPLQHNLWAKDELVPILEGRGKFDEAAVKRADRMLKGTDKKEELQKKHMAKTGAKPEVRRVSAERAEFRIIAVSIASFRH